jgi:hypothetical protein
MCVYDGGDGNGGMPAKACAIGRFGYEDKYSCEPSFVIATFMREQACLYLPPMLKKQRQRTTYVQIDSLNSHANIFAVRHMGVMTVVLYRKVIYFFPEDKIWSQDVEYNQHVYSRFSDRNPVMTFLWKTL